METQKPKDGPVHLRITGTDTKIETLVDDITGTHRFLIAFPHVKIEGVTGLPGRLNFEGYVDVLSKIPITPISLAIISRLLLNTFSGDFTWDFYGTYVINSNSVRAELESGMEMNIVAR